MKKLQNGTVRSHRVVVSYVTIKERWWIHTETQHGDGPMMTRLSSSIRHIQTIER